MIIMVIIMEIIMVIIIMIAFIEDLLCRATNLLAYLVVVWTCPYQPPGM